MEDVAVPLQSEILGGGRGRKRIAEVKGDAYEIRLTISSEQAERKLFGLTLFAHGRGAGLPVVIRPDTGTLRVVFPPLSAPPNIGFFIVNFS